MAVVHLSWHWLAAFPSKLARVGRGLCSGRPQTYRPPSSCTLPALVGMPDLYYVTVPSGEFMQTWRSSGRLRLQLDQPEVQEPYWGLVEAGRTKHVTKRVSVRDNNHAT